MTYDKVIKELLSACKSALNDYQRVMSGRGAPSIMVMNKLEAAIALEKCLPPRLVPSDKDKLINDLQIQVVLLGQEVDRLAGLRC